MIVTDAGRDAVDAAAFCVRWDGRAGDEPVSDQQHADERCCCGRQNRVVLTPRRWRQVSRSCVGPTGLRQNLSAGDGGKRARSPGRARHTPLKPLRAGMPGDSGVLVVTRVRSTTTKCARGRGCNGHPAFPTPFVGRIVHATTRAPGAARMRRCAWNGLFENCTRIRRQGLRLDNADA